MYSFNESNRCEVKICSLASCPFERQWKVLQRVIKLTEFIMVPNNDFLLEQRFVFVVP